MKTINPYYLSTRLTVRKSIRLVVLIVLVVLLEFSSVLRVICI